jgi:hypothetical protein
MTTKRPRIEGFAIVSREGMIAGSDSSFPEALKIPADQEFYQASLDRASAIANGRHSAEGGPKEAARRRIVLTLGTTTRMVPQITLRFEGPDSAGRKHAFDVALDKLMTQPQGMVIGRSADQCELVVAHATVSRRHARLTLAGEALQVEDLGSTNGSAVNGTALSAGAPVALHAGNKLRVGDVELLVRQV